MLLLLLHDYASLTVLLEYFISEYLKFDHLISRDFSSLIILNARKPSNGNKEQPRII